MAAVPQVRQLLKEDLLRPDGTLDGEKLISLLNRFMGDVVTALSRGLTLADNFVAQVKTLKFRTKALVETTFESGAFTFRLDFPQRQVLGVLVLSARDLASDANYFLEGVYADAVPAGNGQMRVRYITGLAADTSYEIRLVVLYA